MSKLGEEEFAKEYQQAWDASQFAATAYYWAIEQQKKALADAMGRCIAEADGELLSPLRAGQCNPRRIYFHATEQERNSIRELEIEAAIYKRFLNEKKRELKYLEKNHSRAPAEDPLKSDEECQRTQFSAAIYSFAYKAIVLIACFIVIKNFL